MCHILKQEEGRKEIIFNSISYVWTGMTNVRERRWSKGPVKESRWRIGIEEKNSHTLPTLRHSSEREVVGTGPGGSGASKLMCPAG